MTTTVISQGEILDKICKHFSVAPPVFIGKKRGKEGIVFIRQIYTYCLWLYTDLNREEIGVLVKRDPTIVSSTIRMIRTRCQVEEVFKKKVIEIEKLFD